MRALWLIVAVSILSALFFLALGDWGGMGVLGAQMVAVACVAVGLRKAERDRPPPPWMR